MRLLSTNPCSLLLFIYADTLEESLSSASKNRIPAVFQCENEVVITYDQLIATGILDSVFLTNSVLSFVSSVVIRDDWAL